MNKFYLIAWIFLFIGFFVLTIVGDNPQYTCIWMVISGIQIDIYKGKLSSKK